MKKLPPPIKTINEEKFLNSPDYDSDIAEDVVMSFDINPDDLDWETYYPLYQAHHFDKYGKFLTL